MQRRPSRRTSVMRVLIGGALAAVLGGASQAWACSPEASLSYVGPPIGIDSRNPVPMQVPLQAIDFPSGSTVVVMDDYTDVVVARGTSVDKSYTAMVTVSAPGPHNFKTEAFTATGDFIPGSRHQGSVFVRDLKPSPTGGDGDAGLGDGGTPITQPGQSVGSTTTLGNTLLAPGPTTPQAQVRPTPRPAAVTPGTAAARTVQSPAIPAAAASGLPAGAGPETKVVPEVGDYVPPPLAPEASNLWSGLDVGERPASLLDGPLKPSNGGASPIGAGLLGLGVLALAGAGAVTGERRFALARRSGS